MGGGWRRAPRIDRTQGRHHATCRKVVPDCTRNRPHRPQQPEQVAAKLDIAPAPPRRRAHGVVAVRNLKTEQKVPVVLDRTAAQPRRVRAVGYKMRPKQPAKERARRPRRKLEREHPGKRVRGAPARRSLDPKRGGTLGNPAARRIPKLGHIGGRKGRDIVKRCKHRGRTRKRRPRVLCHRRHRVGGRPAFGPVARRSGSGVRPCDPAFGVRRSGSEALAVR